MPLLVPHMPPLQSWDQGLSWPGHRHLPLGLGPKPGTVWQMWVSANSMFRYFAFMQLYIQFILVSLVIVCSILPTSLEELDDAILLLLNLIELIKDYKDNIPANIGSMTSVKEMWIRRIQDDSEKKPEKLKWWNNHVQLSQIHWLLSEQLGYLESTLLSTSPFGFSGMTRATTGAAVGGAAEGTTCGRAIVKGLATGLLVNWSFLTFGLVTSWPVSWISTFSGESTSVVASEAPSSSDSYSKGPRTYQIYMMFKEEKVTDWVWFTKCPWNQSRSLWAWP